MVSQVPTLPMGPCRFSYKQLGRIYTDQACTARALSSMSLLQTYQDITQILHPRLELWTERENLMAAGLPINVVAAIQSTRATSTRGLYEFKWRIFEDWCGRKSLPSYQCQITHFFSFVEHIEDSEIMVIRAYMVLCQVCTRLPFSFLKRRGF